MQYCTFYIDELLFAVEVLKVQEIVFHEKITNVPLSSPSIQGLINLRGQIVTAIDLRHRLKIEKNLAEKPNINIIIRNQEELVSLLVDEIGDIIEIGENEIKSDPNSIKNISKNFLNVVYKFKEKLLLVLNIENIINLELN